MDDLIAKVEKMCGKKRKETYGFSSTGTFTAFHALHKAEQFAKDLGFCVGTMCGKEPIGIANAKKFDYIAKWRNLDRIDRFLLDGCILSNDFREGVVTLVIFE